MPFTADINSDAGIDELLAKHVAHLFVRDPLVIFAESIDQDDCVSSDHFEVRSSPEVLRYDSE